MEVNSILFAHELRYHEDKLGDIGNHLLFAFLQIHIGPREVQGSYNYQNLFSLSRPALNSPSIFRCCSATSSTG